MRAIKQGLLAVLVGCACGTATEGAPDGGAVRDAGAHADASESGDAGPSTCNRLILEWQEAIATVSLDCEEHEDCRLVGGTRSCECSRHLHAHGGVAANAASYSNSPASELERAFWALKSDECPDAPRLCDSYDWAVGCVESKCARLNYGCCGTIPGVDPYCDDAGM